MTANRDLKRRVRDRQAQTGESYMTALRHVLAQRPDHMPGAIPSAIPTVEYVDVTEVAAAVGLRCRISVAPELAHSIDVERTLRRLHETLVAAQHDPALSIMRTIALQGRAILGPRPPQGFRQTQQAVQFVKRVRAGIAGVSDDGWRLALPVVPRPASSGEPAATEGSVPVAPEGPLGLFDLWLSFAAARPPLLIVSSLETSFIDQILDRFEQELP